MIFSTTDNCARDCYNKYFHRFTFKCIFDIESTNGDCVNGIFSDIKLKNIVRGNGFIHKLTIKFYSNLSHTSVCYYSKFPIPKMQRQFFKVLSQNPEYVQTHCKELNNSFHFACSRWMIKQ